MDDDRSKAARTLRRIADALGTDMADISASDTLSDDRQAVDNHQEVLELLRLFTSLPNPADRRACIDFVRSVAVRTRAT